MDTLNIFALIILIILGAVLALALILAAMMPGKIAKQRFHQQSEAIAVCGWMGLVTMGLLLPVAYIWAYTSLKPTDIGQ
jgi:NADH:ubiquinone oxidoreductase subunit 6 (subunit J)